MQLTLGFGKQDLSCALNYARPTLGIFTCSSDGNFQECTIKLFWLSLIFTRHKLSPGFLIAFDFQSLFVKYFIQVRFFYRIKEYHPDCCNLVSINMFRNFKHVPKIIFNTMGVRFWHSQKDFLKETVSSKFYPFEFYSKKQING